MSFTSPSISFDTTFLNYPIINCDHIDDLFETYRDYIFFFTDGSKYGNRCGCSVVRGNDIKYFPLPATFSVLSCELFAISAALDMAIENALSLITIYTDSAEAIKTLKSTNSRHPIASQIKDKCHGLQTVIAWIPAHSSILGNELADQGAKKAARITPVPDIPTPKQDLLKLITSKILPNSAPISHVAAASRKEAVALCRVRTGHTLLTHSHIFHKEPPPICSTCQTQLTTFHILLFCKKYDSIRNSLNLPKTIPEIKQNPQILLLFLQKTNILPLL